MANFYTISFGPHMLIPTLGPYNNAPMHYSIQITDSEFLDEPCYVSHGVIVLRICSYITLNLRNANVTIEVSVYEVTIY